jgi:hypothetical protein
MNATRLKPLSQLIVAITATSMVSCATRIPVGTDFREVSDAHETVVDLRFVTNRRLVGSGKGGQYFGDDHGELSAW